MPNLLSAEVSLFRGSADPQPMQVLTLGEVLDRIDHDSYQRAVLRIREILRTQGKEPYDRAKRKLDAATFCGTFSPMRSKSTLIHHSGIVHVDLDHLEDVEGVKRRLMEDPHIVYCFISPSGTGLKVGVLIDPMADDAAYKHAWQAVANAHQQTYGLTWDRSGKDVSRLCYLSWDPDLYRNLAARPFPVPAPALRPVPQPTPPRTACDVPRDRRERYGRQAIETATAMIDASTLGSRHHARLRASELLGGYIAGGILSYDEAWGALAQAVARNSEHPDRSMKTIAAGLQHGQSRAITLEALEAERQAWLREQQSKHAATRCDPPDDSPWAGMSTLPIRPYVGYRGVTIRGGSGHG